MGGSLSTGMILLKIIKSKIFLEQQKPMTGHKQIREIRALIA